MIYVVKYNQLLGILKQDNVSRKITFVYDAAVTKENYIQGLKEKENFSEFLFPIFENMLPEHDQKNLLISQYTITNDIDILAYLDNIHGTFEFYTEETFSTFVSKEWVIFEFDEKKDEILNNSYDFPNILSDYKLNIDDSILYPKGLVNSKVIGLSGYQYKFSVIINEKEKTISQDSTKSSDYFMKPYSKYYSTYDFKDKNRSYIPYLLINEHLFMTLARDFGFDVPYSAIIKHGMDYHYIIKRFDRYKDSKIDHTEILTLMNKVSSEKYKVSMQDLFKIAQEYLSSEEQLKLLKFIIFALVIGHGDLHAKNLSLIYSSNKQNEDKKQNSPFYDISTTKLYKDTKKNDIGLKILNKTNNINKEILLNFAKIVSINEKYVEIYINEVCVKFRDTFLTYIEKLPSDIKGLQFNTSRYSRTTLEGILKEYYRNRLKYISEYLDVLDEKQVEEEIWD